MTHFGKIVFLDFDGVVIPMRDKLSEINFDPDCVARLNLILASSGASVVVTSSHRHDVGLDLLGYLTKNGVAINPDQYLGFTPDDPADHRGTEIEMWIEKNRFRGEFVILDDDDAMEPYMDHLVNTDAFVGLTKENVADALTILRS